MESTKRRTYTSEQRAAVVADVAASGVRGAARKHGVPQSCVSRWAAAGGVARAEGARTARASVAVVEDSPSTREPVQPASSVEAAPVAEAAATGHSTKSEAAASAPPATRVSRSHVAKVYTPSQEEATARHGRPERVMHDRGSAFWSWRGISRFTDLLTEMGIDQVVAEHKEWNGKVEVFNANLHKELFDAHRFYDGRDAPPARGTPALVQPRAHAPRARRAAGTGGPLLRVAEVTSRGGTPEVWLLGQKLLGPPG